MALKDILVVDSESGSLRQFTEELDPKMAALRIVSDVETVAESISRQDERTELPRPDIVVLDLDLPPEMGIELVSRVKDSAEWKRVPIVALASEGDTAEIRRAYDHHVNAVLRKPDTSTEFRRLVGAFEDFWLSTVRLPPQ